MKTIALTQDKVALVDDRDYAWLSQWKWYATHENRNWYAIRWRRKADGQSPYQLRMHRVILGAPQNVGVDHRNGNGLDNQRDNLRLASPLLNARNHVHQKRDRKHDLPMGVFPAGSRFEASRGRQYLGCFGTPEGAHAAYVRARAEAADEAEGLFLISVGASHQKKPSAPRPASKSRANLSAKIEKRCPSCRLVLSRDSFYHHSTRPGGLSVYCRDCQKKKQMEKIVVLTNPTSV